MSACWTDTSQSRLGTAGNNEEGFKPQRPAAQCEFTHGMSARYNDGGISEAAQSNAERPLLGNL